MDQQNTPFHNDLKDVGVTLTCPTCGGKLDLSPSEAFFPGRPTLLTCQHCGNRHLIYQETGQVRLETSNLCPKCTQNDRVEKVSDIVLHNLQPSELADRLALPPKPSSLRWSTAGIFYFLALTNATAWIVIAFLAAPIWVVPLAFVLQVLGYDAESLSAGAAAAVLGVGFLLTYLVGGVGVSLLLVAIGLGFFRRRSKGEKRMTPAEEKASQAERLEKWNRARTRWERLYYCHRDDLVFTPGDSALIPPREVRTYLFRDETTPQA